MFFDEMRRKKHVVDDEGEAELNAHVWFMT